MNIVFFTHDMSMGGAQRVISVLANQLCKDGHNIRIVLTDNNPNIAYKLTNDITTVQLDEWFYKKETIIKKLRLFKYKLQRRLQKDRCDFLEELMFRRNITDDLVLYFKNHPADIIIGFLVDQNILLGLGANRIKSKIIVAERNYPNRPTFQNDFKKLRNYCYGKADICVFQTKEQAMMFPPAVQKKAVVISNPVKKNLPEPFVGEREKIIVNYCGYKEHKNISLLIDAFSIVAKKHPDYHLEVYGYGGQKDMLQEKINNMGLKDKIALLPFESNIHEKVKNRAMFVMTSDYEGMPNALIEALAIGLPSIATDCLGGGAKAVIENEVNGLIVPCDDSKAVADAICDLIENPQKAKSFSKKSPEIRKTLSVEKIAQQWIDCILKQS